MLVSGDERVSQETKSENLSTKIGPLPGAVDARMVRCGKPNCRCERTAELHGPYYVRRWRVAGERRSKYIKKQDILSTKHAVETYRRQQKQTRQELRDALRTFRNLRTFIFDLLLRDLQ